MEIIYLTTVKLGYNELGYNEHSVITNKQFGPKCPFTTQIDPVIIKSLKRLAPESKKPFESQKYTKKAKNETITIKKLFLLFNIYCIKISTIF